MSDRAATERPLGDPQCAVPTAGWSRELTPSGHVPRNARQHLHPSARLLYNERENLGQALGLVKVTLKPS